MRFQQPQGGGGHRCSHHEGRRYFEGGDGFGGQFGGPGGGPGHGRHGHGGPGGHGRFGGHRARRGEARYIVLDVLKDGPKHGYDIIRTIDERTNGAWAPSPGTVYPTLQLLEDLGWIKSEASDDRKAFSITEAGLAELETRSEELSQFWARFTSSSEPLQVEMGFIRDEMASLVRTLWRGTQGAKDAETLRKFRAVITAANEEIRGLLSQEQA